MLESFQGDRMTGTGFRVQGLRFRMFGIQASPSLGVRV